MSSQNSPTVRRRKADTKLIAGPYQPPRTRKGDVLYCELYGESVVAQYTDRLGWPCASRRKLRSPILCGDLVWAVQTESTKAVAYWWEVSRLTVYRWKRSLGVGRMTDGTRRLKRLQTFSDADRARSAETNRTSRRRRGQSRIARERWAGGRWGSLRRWTDKELQLLGRLPDAAVAHGTGRTLTAVTHKRRELKIHLKRPVR